MRIGNFSHAKFKIGGSHFYFFESRIFGDEQRFAIQSPIFSIFIFISISVSISISSPIVRLHFCTRSLYPRTVKPTTLNRGRDRPTHPHTHTHRRTHTHTHVWTDKISIATNSDNIEVEIRNLIL